MGVGETTGDITTAKGTKNCCHLRLTIEKLYLRKTKVQLHNKDIASRQNQIQPSELSLYSPPIYHRVNTGTGSCAWCSRRSGKEATRAQAKTWTHHNATWTVAEDEREASSNERTFANEKKCFDERFDENASKNDEQLNLKKSQQYQQCASESSKAMDIF